RRLPERLSPIRLLGDEAAGREPGQRAFDARFVGVHVLDDERLVASKVALDLLVCGRGVEEARVEIEGEAWKLVLAPGLIVGTHLREALWPGQVVSLEPHGHRTITGRSKEMPGILHVGKGVHLLGADVDWCDPSADRVRRVALAAEGVAPGDG